MKKTRWFFLAVLVVLLATVNMAPAAATTAPANGNMVAVANDSPPTAHSADLNILLTVTNSTQAPDQTVGVAMNSNVAVATTSPPAATKMNTGANNNPAANASPAWRSAAVKAPTARSNCFATG